MASINESTLILIKALMTLPPAKFKKLSNDLVEIQESKDTELITLKVQVALDSDYSAMYRATKLMMDSVVGPHSEQTFITGMFLDGLSRNAKSVTSAMMTLNYFIGGSAAPDFSGGGIEDGEE